ncbi:peptidoglycan DD-metalloendopeptidase family protein [Micromonospora sp. NPDC050200]|uniref:M23 family metallopeptidase n=1 Tax=Micromonospora sp. NPDC050200 TaxID=3155664 RepID=UPI0033F3CDB8
MDYGMSVGTQLPAAGGGVVTNDPNNGTGGYTVTVQHDNGYRTQYLHLSQSFNDYLNRAGAGSHRRQTTPDATAGNPTNTAASGQAVPTPPHRTKTESGPPDPESEATPRDPPRSNPTQATTDPAHRLANPSSAGPKHPVPNKMSNIDS